MVIAKVTVRLKRGGKFEYRYIVASNQETAEKALTEQKLETFPVEWINASAISNIGIQCNPFLKEN